MLNSNQAEASSTTEDLIPPKQLRLAVGGSFKIIGAEFFQYFIELGGLKPDEKVLDIGCGCGRMAVPLTRYLDRTGSYDGFDIVAEGIEWCSNVISPKYPNFHFQLADIYNLYYNPSGKYKASEYNFPYQNEKFDFVFLTSVFTHILPEDIENYLAQIARVLRKGGRGLMSFYLLNKESLDLMENGKSYIKFEHEFGSYRVADINSPEMAIAYNEEFVTDLCDRHGLKIQQPISYGAWCGRSNFLSQQDILIFSKD